MLSASVVIDIHAQILIELHACVWIVPAGKEDVSLPYLLYLQGGPGFESPRPMEAGGWLKKACEDHRVVLLDQVRMHVGGCAPMRCGAWLSCVDILLVFSEEQDCPHLWHHHHFRKLHLLQSKRSTWSISGQIILLRMQNLFACVLYQTLSLGQS